MKKMKENVYFRDIKTKKARTVLIGNSLLQSVIYIINIYVIHNWNSTTNKNIFKLTDNYIYWISIFQDNIIPNLTDFLESSLRVRPLPGPILLDRYIII